MEAVHEAIKSLLGLYIGVLFAWPALVWMVRKGVDARYKGAVAEDLKRLAGPLTGLVLLLVPVFTLDPFFGIMAFSLWGSLLVSGAKNNQNAREDAAREAAREQARLRALHKIDSDDSSFK